MDSKVKSSPEEIETMIYFEHVPDEISSHPRSDQMPVGDIAAIYLALILALQHVAHDLVSVLLNDAIPANFLYGTDVGILFLLGLCLFLTLAKYVGCECDGLTHSLLWRRMIFH